MNALIFIALLGFAAAQTQIVAIDGGFSPNQYLYIFNIGSNPATVASRTFITGMNANDTLLTLATLPSTAGGDVYGVSLLGNGGIYRININTAAATFVSTLTCNVTKSNPTLSADFNPNNGLLTILTLVQGGGTGSTNFYNINYQTGACTPQTAAQFANSSALPIRAAGIFYRFNGNNTDPTLFIVETASSTLATVSPTGGAVTSVGPLGAGFLSGVGGSALGYGNPSTGISVLYNSTFNSSAIYTIDLSSGAAVNTANLTLFTNLLGLAVGNNRFPAGVIGVGGTGTGSNTGTTTGNGNNNNNGGNGVIVVTAGQATATATVTNTATNTYTTTANVADTNGVSTQTITVIPSGAGTFTKTIQVNNGGGTTSTALATVSENGIEAFSTTGVISLGGSSATAGATVQIPAGQSTGSASYSFSGTDGNTFSRSAVVLVGGVDAITLPTFSIGGGNQQQTAVVTVGDTNGRTSTQVATINLQYGRFNSASVAQISIVAVVAAVALLF